MKSTVRLENDLTTPVHDEVKKSIAASSLVKWVGLLPLILALWLWVASWSQFDLNQMNGLGLVAILPARFILALAVLTVTFVYLIHKQTTPPLLPLVYVAGLIVMIHATPNILYGTLRYAWAWKHVAIVDYIQRHGMVDPTIEELGAYHNWPGFFTANALVTQLAGIPSTLGYAGWGPLFFNLLDMGAIVIIFRTLTGDRRLIGLGVWFFILANWIGQDYFSPQATTYFLYLVVLYACLAWFRDPDSPTIWSFLQRIRFRRLPFIRLDKFPLQNDTSRFSGADLSSSHRVLLMGIVIILLVAIASTHQLTPLMMTSALAGLVIFRCLRSRSLPVLMGVLTTTWILYVAVGFFNGNLAPIVKGFGELGSNLRSNLIDLSAVSPGQAEIAKMDRALTGLVWVLGIAGMIRRLHQGKWDLPAIILTFTPFPMLLFSPYGGEILFRVYYFSLPFVAFFAAGLFFPGAPHGRTLLTPVILGVTSLAMLAGLIFGYYGKEGINYFSKNEVAAAQYLQRNAKPGSLIMSVGWDWPLITQHYEYYEYESLSNYSRPARLEVLNDPVNLIAKEMSYYPSAYLFVTHSQEINANMTGEMPPGSLSAMVNKLDASPRFQVVFRNPDAVVYSLARSGGK